MKPEPLDLPPGARLLDRYVILSRVGSGGMASIYRAMDERLDRVVCVKLLRTVLEGSGSTGGRNLFEATYAHFLQEALALSRLQHPNTLRIYDFGYLPTSGRPFQISEYLEGGNLEEYVKERGAIAPAEVLAILERVTGAVEEAHAHKIIHRDIKPSNIIFGKVGEYLMPKLADFGIAHSNIKKRKAGQDTWDEDTGTVSAVALFSPRWAAPEQLSGEPQGPATDVYALGLLSVFMLAGRPLFEGGDVRGTFNDRVRGDVLVGRLLGDYGVAPELHAALMRALAARPEQRASSPSAFLASLRAAIGALPPGAAAAAALRRDTPVVIPPAALARAIANAKLPAAPRRPPSPTLIDRRGSSAPPAPVPSPPPPQVAAPPAPLPPAPGPMPRFVDVQEKIDLTFPGAGEEIRFRLTFVPVSGTTFRVMIKGLSSFVATEGKRASPALTLQGDATARFVSTAGVDLGTMDVSFGVERTGNQGPERAFQGPMGEMVVPFTHAVHAVALRIGGDLLVACHR